MTNRLTGTYVATALPPRLFDIPAPVTATHTSMLANTAEKKASPKLLEPIMKLSVNTPEDYVGDIIGDLNSRRGQINGIETQFGNQLVSAFVPLANLFGYVKTLRSLSQGRANPYMELSHYSEVPQNVADEVIKKMTK